MAKVLPAGARLAMRPSSRRRRWREPPHSRRIGGIREVGACLQAPRLQRGIAGGKGLERSKIVLPTQSIDPLPHDPSFANEKRGTAESCTCFVGLAGAPVQRCSPRSLPREMPTCPVARGGRGEESRMRRQACAIRVYASSSCVVWCTCACVRSVARYF